MTSPNPTDNPTVATPLSPDSELVSSTKAAARNKRPMPRGVRRGTGGKVFKTRATASSIEAVPTTPSTQDEMMLVSQSVREAREQRLCGSPLFRYAADVYHTAVLKNKSSGEKDYRGATSAAILEKMCSDTQQTAENVKMARHGVGPLSHGVKRSAPPSIFKEESIPKKPFHGTAT